MSKTIKQIADELGVSKTAVYKKIDNLGLRSSLRKNANQFTVDKTQEKLIKQAFSENKSQTKNANQVCEIDNQSETVSTLVSMLQNELEAKNRQLEEKDRQIERLQKLLDQQQQLNLIDKNKVLQIEEKTSFWKRFKK